MKNYMLGLYEKSMPASLSWKEKLQNAKTAGFDFLEISIDETDEKISRLDYSKKERFDILKSIYEIGIPIMTMCLSGHRKYPIGSSDTAISNMGMQLMAKAIDFSCDLGIRIIQLAGYDVYYEQSTDETKLIFSDNLKKCVEMASKKGIILAFETMETEFMNTVTKSMHYVKELESPYLQIYPDSGNLTNASLKDHNCVCDDLNSGKGHIAALHLKESLPGQFREIPFGEGHVDFRKIIATAWALGVRIFVSEFWCVGNNDWGNDLKAAKAFFDDKFIQVTGSR